MIRLVGLDDQSLFAEARGQRLSAGADIPVGLPTHATGRPVKTVTRGHTNIVAAQHFLIYI